MSTSDTQKLAQDVLDRLGARTSASGDGDLASRSPIDGSQIGSVRSTPPDEADAIMARAQAAFSHWRNVPAPRRGDFVRLIGDALREAKEDLGALVSLEAGKIRSEGLGEVQEMIDICDFAVGQSRQLHGLTMASERPGHRMSETWHPAGPVLVITAFNFPVAVWSWNAALACVCGDPVIWKPSEKTPLTALAVQAIVDKVARGFPEAPEDLLQVAFGGSDLGEALVAHPGAPVVSATGSTRMGRAVAPVVAARFGTAILELGGNNAMIVGPSADLDLALRAIVFSAVGTAGQRCTSLRRLIVHEDVRDGLIERLTATYGRLKVGNPLDEDVLVGPLIDKAAGKAMAAALETAASDGGRVHGGGPLTDGAPVGGTYVRPAIVEMPSQTDIVRRETFAPILYAIGYSDFDEAIALHNGVQQGLSSCVFTNDLREAERFLSATGSDCGLANVNIGPSGAEIGGAFGGEKETGGGRESGSDAWRGYMRRQTATVNWSRALPLAQGVSFDA